jgi:serine/threonine-protein kinase
MLMADRKNFIADRYEVISHIGQGGMADVFLAVDTILNRQVAVKILRADLSTDAVSILRFEREAQAAASLAHPNIVEIYDVGEYKGHHYIVMEYLPGKSLKQVIRLRAPLVVEEAVDIMKQLCSAVAEAHSRGIIHRDIKPQNVIVNADGSVKILDFGIATAKGSMQLTQANNVMGSVHYLAPELAKGDAASPQSDIYALGIVLYEMLAGDVPFKADQAVQVAIKHMRDPMPSVRNVNPSVPQSVENIITRSTAKDPHQRYRSADEMLRDVSTCLRPDRLNEKKLVLKEPVQEKVYAPQPSQAKPLSDYDSGSEDTGSTRKTSGNKKKTKILICILAVLCAAGIFAGLVMTDVIHFGPRTSQIPDLSGKTVDEASSELEELKLTLDQNNITYTLTKDTEKGQIISTDPEAGTEVEQGTSVKAEVSSGIGVTVKDYTGENINDAEDDLSQYSLLKVTAVEEDSTETPGTIIRQEQLEAGDLFDANSAAKITLVYSAYPTVTIPADIIGKSVQDAQNELEAMGISVRTSNIDTSTLTQEQLEALQIGIVIKSDPATETSYTQKEDNFVTLYYY